MPEKKNDCNFCYPDEAIESTVLNRGNGMYTFLSNPRFRRNHLLVVPTEHYLGEDTGNTEILGRIAYEARSWANVVDFGYGSVITQKSQPRQAENGIKRDHMHFHVWPRTKQDEANGVVIPAPQSFDEFYRPTDEKEIAELNEDIQRNKRELRLMFLRKKGMPWPDIWKLIEKDPEYGTS